MSEKWVREILFEYKKLWVLFIHWLSRIFWRQCHRTGVRLIETTTVTRAISAFLSLFIAMQLGLIIYGKLTFSSGSKATNYFLVVDNITAEQFSYSPNIINHSQANKKDVRLKKYSNNYFMVEYRINPSLWELFWGIETDLKCEVTGVDLDGPYLTIMGLYKPEKAVWIGKIDEIQNAYWEYKIKFFRAPQGLN